MTNDTRNPHKEYMQSVTVRRFAKLAKLFYRQPNRLQLMLSTTFLTPLERI